MSPGMTWSSPQFAAYVAAACGPTRPRAPARSPRRRTRPSCPRSLRRGRSRSAWSWHVAYGPAPTVSAATPWRDRSDSCDLHRQSLRQSSCPQRSGSASGGTSSLSLVHACGRRTPATSRHGRAAGIDPGPSEGGRTRCPNPQSWATSEATRRSMQGNRGRDTGPEMAVRRIVHYARLRYRVDARPIACVESSCRSGLHSSARWRCSSTAASGTAAPTTTRWRRRTLTYWAEKVADATAQRDLDTSERLREAGMASSPVLGARAARPTSPRRSSARYASAFQRRCHRRSEPMTRRVPPRRRRR